MRSLHRVIKSTDVVIGEKKRLDVNAVYAANIIKSRVQEEEDLPTAAERLATIQKECAALQEQGMAERDQLIEQGHQEARQIIEEAYEDSKKILEDARKKGYEEGLQSGRQAGYDSMEALIQEAADIKRQTLDEKKVVAKALEQDLIHLVLTSVRKILDHELAENHELLLNLIGEGLEKCTFTETLVIKVAREDYETIAASKNKIYMMTEGIESLEIKVDGALKKGSIVIETLSGTIDAGVEAQVAMVERLFEELLRNE